MEARPAVKDDKMKPTHLLVVPALAAAVSGCTVNHYHYHGVPPAMPAAQDTPGHDALGEKLKGIHAAIEVTADNLANVDTLGYKSRRAVFHEGQTMPVITTDWTPGSAIETPSELALYINGRGFFQIEVIEEKGGGIAYTRMGDFFLNRDGELVLGHSGGPRLADGITVPDDTVGINVSADGIMTAVLPDNSESEIGQIELHSFISPQGLERSGSGLYFETEASGPAISGTPGEGVLGTLRQRLLESSNVDFVPEMAQLNKLTRWSNSIHQQLGLPAPPAVRATAEKPENLPVSSLLEGPEAGG